MRNWRLDEDEEEGEPKPDMPMTAGPVQNALFKSRTVLIFDPWQADCTALIGPASSSFAAARDRCAQRDIHVVPSQCSNPQLWVS